MNKLLGGAIGSLLNSESSLLIQSQQAMGRTQRVGMSTVTVKPKQFTTLKKCEASLRHQTKFKKSRYGKSPIDNSNFIKTLKVEKIYDQITNAAPTHPGK